MLPAGSSTRRSSLTTTRPRVRGRQPPPRPLPAVDAQVSGLIVHRWTARVSWLTPTASSRQARTFMSPRIGKLIEPVTSVAGNLLEANLSSV
jgi:hypothetical protein